MSDTLPPAPGKRARLPRILLMAGAVLLILALTPAVVVSRLEENDRFCASCHIAPERTYYNRAQFALAGVDPVADLASAHYRSDPADLPRQQPFRCIDCHRGDEGIAHRATALALGARDTAIYFLGNPDQTLEKTDIEVPVLLTESCLKCHADTLLEVGFENHYHSKLAATYRIWQQGGTLTIPDDANPNLYQPVLEMGLQPVEGVDMLCVDCHLAHVNTPGAELVSFIDLEKVVYPACEECHIADFGAPLGLTNVGSGIDGLGEEAP